MHTAIDSKYLICLTQVLRCSEHFDVGVLTQQLDEVVPSCTLVFDHESSKQRRHLVILAATEFGEGPKFRRKPWVQVRLSVRVAAAVEILVFRTLNDDVQKIAANDTDPSTIGTFASILVTNE